MIGENILLAISSLRSNKMRSLLTMLGIIIGITSIIAIMIIGDGMTATVSETLSSFGTNNITVSLQERGQQSNGMMSFAGGGSARMFVSGGLVGKSPETDDLMSTQMIEDFQEEFSDRIDGVSLNFSSGSGQAKDGELYANVSIMGTNDGYFIANSLTLLQGRLTSDSDVKSNSQTAVVSDKFVANMFPDGENPIGKQVKIYKTNQIEIYTIIGVYEYEENGFSGSTASEKEMTTTLYIPVSTAKQDWLEKNYNNMTVIGSKELDVVKLTEEIQLYFDKLYAHNDSWKLNVSNMSSMLETVTSTLSTISIAIAFIAGISLLVGGIGVMNIMLVSVTERTREIGTRKALGARNFHIQLQFVTEAIIISAVGGIIGLILGILAGAGISQAFDIQFALSPFVAFGSVLFSMMIGIFFGLYPASKAAKLDPIEALRYE